MGTNPQHEIMDRVAGCLEAHEECVSSLYGVLAQTYPETSDFWTGLSREEHSHAQMLTHMMHMIESGKARFAFGHIHMDALARSTQNLKDEIKRFEETPPGLPVAFATALAIEKGLIENKFYEVISGDDEHIHRLKTTMTQYILKHISKLEKEWSKHVTPEQNKENTEPDVPKAVDSSPPPPKEQAAAKANPPPPKTEKATTPSSAHAGEHGVNGWGGLNDVYIEVVQKLMQHEVVTAQYGSEIDTFQQIGKKLKAVSDSQGLDLSKPSFQLQPSHHQNNGLGAFKDACADVEQKIAQREFVVAQHESEAKALQEIRQKLETSFESLGLDLPKPPFHMPRTQHKNKRTRHGKRHRSHTAVEYWGNLLVEE